MARLEKLVSSDKEMQRQYTELSGRIATETAAMQTLAGKLEDSKGAKDRARDLQTQREEAYRKAFHALVAEQTGLEELYGPLMARLNGGGRSRIHYLALSRLKQGFDSPSLMTPNTPRFWPAMKTRRGFCALWPRYPLST
jgi:hypothetical protein